MNSLNDIWESVMEILRQELTPTAINTWFSDCVPIEIGNSRMTIHTTSTFKRSIINERFSDTI